MALFAIADLHLAKDPSVEKPMDVFGSGWERHDERLREDWLSRVAPCDTVIIAGDISWGLKLSEAEADLSWIAELPGRKLLIRGNHDLWWASLAKMRALLKEKGIEDIDFIQNDSRRLESEKDGKSIALCGTRGWVCPGGSEFTEHDRKIYERELLRLEMSLKSAEGADEIVCALHYPPMNERFEDSGFTELIERYSVSKLVYGHLHGRSVWPRGFRGMRNGVEYELVSLDYMDCRLKRLI